MNISVSKLSDAKLVVGRFNSVMRSSITDENIAEAFARFISEIESPGGICSELQERIEELESLCNKLTKAIESNCEALTNSLDELADALPPKSRPQKMQAELDNLRYFVEALYSNVY